MILLRQYGLPLILALLLHAGVAAALVRGWESGAGDDPRVVVPRIIHAHLLVVEKPAPQSVSPQVKPAPPPAKPAPAKPLPKPVATPKPAPPKPPPPKPEQRDAEAERRAQAEVRRQQRLRELYESSTALALQEEVVDAGQAQASTMTYVDAISRAIVAEWSRPPSARNDMAARIQVDLTPSGDLLGVLVLESSGNNAFDRSAEAAVHKAARTLGRFPVPADHSLFEAEFRHLTLLFKPTDLLR